MDVDNDNFYDEIASFMPPPGDYSLEDLDEIIRSTDSHLDASLDMNAFTNVFNQTDFDMNIADANVPSYFKQSSSLQKPQCLSLENEKQTGFGNDFSCNFGSFSSPASSQYSTDYSSPHKTPPRTSSPSSLHDDLFNPDDFINFFSDDDVKIDKLTTDSITQLIDDHRNTPSPTGSCASSSGSSTSGVHSDASSVASISQHYKREPNDELLEFIKFKDDRTDQDFESIDNAAVNVCNQFDNNSAVIKDEVQVLGTSTATFLPMTVPPLPIVAIQHTPPVQGTIIPVQTIPLTTVNQVVNIKAPTAIKIEKKTPVSPAVAKTLKLVNTSANNSNEATSKIIPPPNSKPKTIYLSSNDFQTLMQKVNTNGKKITGPNIQMPKIIMKTASGKVIAANSSNILTSTVQSGTAKNSPITGLKSLQFVSKVGKPSEPITAKQQQQPKVVSSNSRSAAVMAAARATLGHTKLGRNEFAMLRGLTDEKLLKKQLRMLKNRESASLSRKKKKEYIEKLENRISDLEKQNYSLKGENKSLRSQLMAFAQTCNCKHGNISEFILNTLNMDDKNGAAVLDSTDASYLIKNAKQHFNNCNHNGNNNLNNSAASTMQHIKIAPKPPNAGPFINKGFKQRVSSTNVKKNIAVLFAMAFMVTLNVGNFQNYLIKSTLENAIETSAADANEELVIQTGRRLLWVPNEHEFHEQANRSKRDTEMANMPPPPLHFLRPNNRATGDKMNGNSARGEPPIKRPMAAYGNATLENMRLARNLHKWIGGNDFLNLTGIRTDNHIDEMKHFKLGSGSYMDYDDIMLQAPLGRKQKRKIIFDTQTPEKYAKFSAEGGGHNSLDIFKPRVSEEYLRLFKGIKRQDDTFYVLSFNMDHILLPASAYNKSSRPKMSLMLPAGDPSNNGDVVLMQIDCEVINTTELEIKSHMIPEKLRPAKFTANVRVNPHDVANNETDGPTSATAAKTKANATRKEESKEKPFVPRTYFMMGPKNQASPQTANIVGNGTNIVKRKPTVVKLNATDSVIGSGILNVRNSSLFSRMRDTVGSQGTGFLAITDVKKLT